MSKMAVPNVLLNNGLTMPHLGLGTFNSRPGLEDHIVDGINVGYRLIDTAFFYNNENKIGVGLNKVLNEGKVKRQDLFISSKLPDTEHATADVVPSIKASLKCLQLDYLDLYLIHWPMALKGSKEADIPLEDTWKGMEACVKQGLAKSIGLSNFNSKQIERILKVATIKPVVNQVECNPYFSQEKLRKFCKDRDIVVMAFSPLYAPGRPGSVSHGMNLFVEPVVEELASKYHKDESQVILRYLIQCGVVPIPKTDNKNHLRSNLAVFDFVLSQDHFEKMKSLNKNIRCTDPKEYSHMKEYPFKIEF